MNPFKYQSNKLKKLFKAQVPELNQFIGRTIIIEGKPVTIHSVVGNATKRTFYEINGKHLMGMLRFHAMMEGDDSITEQEFRDFENMIVDAEKLPEKKVIGMM